MAGRCRLPLSRPTATCDTPRFHSLSFKISSRTSTPGGGNIKICGMGRAGRAAWNRICWPVLQAFSSVHSTSKRLIEPPHTLQAYCSPVVRCVTSLTAEKPAARPARHHVASGAGNPLSCKTAVQLCSLLPHPLCRGSCQIHSRLPRAGCATTGCYACTARLAYWHT